jgi:Cdc6-like AAA superfamily ATPase
MEIQEQIKKSIRDTNNLYQKLILLVGKSGSGKTKVLQEISEDLAAPMINVNLEISYRLLDLPVDKRASTLSRLFSQVINDSESEIVLLDNIEILFDKSLQQNPLALLQTNSKNKAMIAAWNGKIESERLIYAMPDHHEYRSYPIEKTGITIDLNSVQAG